MKINETKGAIGVLAMLAFLSVSILIVAVVAIVINNTKTVVREKQSTTALFLARSGIEKALLWLNKDPQNWRGWNNIHVNEEFQNNIEFTDVTGGSYYVNITKVGEQLKITSVGRDSNGKEMRAIEVILEKKDYSGPALIAKKVDINGSAEIHWGPVHALEGGINLQGSVANNRYPRLFSRGPVILPNLHVKDISLDPPNTDNAFYWAFSSLPQMPPIDFEKYRKEAIGTNEVDDPYPTDTYYNSDWTFKGDNLLTPTTYYIEGNVTLQNSCLRGVLVVLGDLDFKGNGSGVNINVNAPDNYRVEYSSAIANGFDPGAEFGDPPNANINNLAFQGLIIVKGNISHNGNHTVYGAIISQGGTNGWGNLTVYYDPSAYDKLYLTDDNPIIQVSWREVPADNKVLPSAWQP